MRSADNENGQLLAGTLVDYLMPNTSEVSDLQVAHAEHTSPFRSWDGYCLDRYFRVRYLNVKI